MLYPFMTLADETEIVHSEAKYVDGRELVKVCIEQPVDWGFKSAECVLPDYIWSNIQGYSAEEVSELDALIHSLSHIIIQLAREGGFSHAAAV